MNRHTHDGDVDKEKLVPLNVMVPQNVKAWIEDTAWEQRTSMGEMARKLLREKFDDAHPKE